MVDISSQISGINLQEARKIIQQRAGEETQDWETVTEDLRQLGEKLLGNTCGNMKQGKETW